MGPWDGVNKASKYIETLKKEIARQKEKMEAAERRIEECSREIEAVLNAINGAEKDKE